VIPADIDKQANTLFDRTSLDVLSRNKVLYRNTDRFVECDLLRRLATFCAATDQIGNL